MSLLQTKPTLKLDWCSHKAAEYAVKHWHYSRRMPTSTTVKIGVWEDENFIGCVIFGVGSGNATNGVSYGLRRHSDMAELARIALKKHKTPVSRIVSVAIRLLQKQSPGLLLLVSYADPAFGHHGGIYAGGNWIYTGLETTQQKLYQINGKWCHSRTAGHQVSTVKGLPSRKLPRKHRYLMPLTDAMRLQLAPLAKPYPKRICAASIDSDAPGFQPEEGGADPTAALQLTD